MKIEIIPAILPKDFAELTEKIELIKGFTKKIQVDICDGHFVPNFTWPYKKHDVNFEHIIKEEDGLPGWDTLDYEFDLMVDKPEETVEQWVSAGAARIILHVEAKGDLAKAVEILQGKVEIGIALAVDTPIEAIDNPIFNVQEGKIQFVQLMGIDNIGFQHQSFDEKVIGRVKQVRLKYPTLPISVDGGVSLETAPALIAAGTDRLVVGSAIFDSDNYIEAIERFRRL